MNISKLLRLACLYAEQDRMAFVESYDGMEDDPDCREAVAFLLQLRKYRKKRLGRSASDELDEAVEKVVSTDAP